jgi:hypothetical protein
MPKFEGVTEGTSSGNLTPAEVILAEQDSGRVKFWSMVRKDRPPIRPVDFDQAVDWGPNDILRLMEHDVNDFRLRTANFCWGYLRKLPSLLALDEPQFIAKVKIAEDELARSPGKRSTAASGMEFWAAMVGTLYCRVRPSLLREAFTQERRLGKRTVSARGSIYDWTKSGMTMVLLTLREIDSAKP